MSSFFYFQLLLSPVGGKCYLVLVEENNPKEIISYAKERGMNAKVSTYVRCQMLIYLGLVLVYNFFFFIVFGIYLFFMLSS